MSSPASRESFRAPVERRVLRDRVYDLILEMLMRGDVQPGSRLGIEFVAQELDVSPTPVREALVQLERTGLVSREARRGYRIAEPLTVEQVLQVYDARLVIEAGAIELAAVRIDSFIEDLQSVQSRHRAAAEAVLGEAPHTALSRQMLIEYFEADWAFHLVILRNSANHYLLEAAESLGTHLHRRRQTVILRENDVRFAVDEHDAIVSALRRRDPDAAVTAMRVHIANVRERAAAAAVQEQRPRS